MSVKLITRAFETDLPTTQKFVFLALCDNASDEGFCFPSIQTLCKKTSLKERAVQGAIKTLVELGYMTIRTRRGQSTVYIVKPPEEWPRNLSTTPAPDAPPHEMHPASNAGDPRRKCAPPPQEMRGTPARDAPITVIEPSYNHQGTVRECAREPEPVDNPKPPDKPAKRKTRLPENWFLPKDWGSWALEQGLAESEIRTEAECFADYWRSKGETRADWQATWRNWIRRSKTFSRSKVPRRETISERNARIEREIFGARANDEARTVDMETAA